MRERNFWRGESSKSERQRDLGAVEAGDFPAVELAEKIILGTRDEVDHFAFERFFFGEGFGVGDGSRGKNRVAIALVGVAAEKGERVVVDFLAHRFVDGHGVAADDHHG